MRLHLSGFLFPTWIAACFLLAGCWASASSTHWIGGVPDFVRRPDSGFHAPADASSRNAPDEIAAEHAQRSYLPRLGGGENRRRRLCGRWFAPCTGKGLLRFQRQAAKDSRIPVRKLSFPTLQTRQTRYRRFFARQLNRQQQVLKEFVPVPNIVRKTTNADPLPQLTQPAQPVRPKLTIEQLKAPVQNDFNASKCCRPALFVP